MMLMKAEPYFMYGGAKIRLSSVYLLECEEEEIMLLNFMNVEVYEERGIISTYITVY